MILARLLGKKFFCMPQSFGPSQNFLIRWCARIGLDRVTYIMPRGKKSAGFIEQLHLKNRHCSFVPDLAFSYRNPLPVDDERIYRRFGISAETRYVGVLFNAHLYRWGGMRTIDILAKEIDRLITIHTCRIILLAHEIDETRPVDDRYVNTLIFQRCSNKEKILVINDDLSANEIKSLIKVCDFTICSRFHGMISSLKVGVVPVIIGWAEKYSEIMELFDAGDLVLSFDAVNPDKLAALTEQVLRDNEFLKRRIAIRRAEYENASERAREIILQYGSS
jgi:polysaccharide pyruvyl transferase WcaK-like protein